MRRLLVPHDSAVTAPEINMTPLVDVALVLVIIFLATCTLATPAGIRILSGGSSGQPGAEPIRIDVSPPDVIRVAGSRVHLASLPVVLTAAFAAGAEGAFVSVARGVRHDTAVEILETAKRCGAKSVALDSLSTPPSASRPRGGGPP